MAARKPNEKRDTPGDEASFDQVLEQLRVVVGQLERGELTLEESLASYERGVALTRRGHDLLHAAEKRIELLVGPGGATAPLAAASDEEDDDGDRQGA
ncbi:MAG: exodeoxyribonuclease VII small subunit [Myxococcales bacterium]|nr:exodeoxyribonuclease VII small subunit [Myxococcales bacterium]